MGNYGNDWRIYEIEIPIEDLNANVRGYGYGIKNADI